MATVIDVPTQKGGSCKTTTVLEMMGEAARSGARVLAIDLDPQGSLSDVLKIENRRSATIYDVLAGYVTAADAVQRWEHKAVRCDVIAANENLAQVGTLIDGNYHVLAKALEPIRTNYDFVLIDSAPMPQTALAFNALYASDWVLVPTRASMQYVDSLPKTVTTIEAFANANGGRPSIAGVVLCDHPSRDDARNWEAVARLYCDRVGIRMFDPVRHSCAVCNAQTARLPVVLHARSRPVAKDYRRLCAELFELVGLEVQ